MVHVVHRSIQVYQDFHRQTLSHLQRLEQTCYFLLPQADPEKIFGMVEQAHGIKAEACYLHLTGVEKLAHHVKGRYAALLDQSSIFERNQLTQLIQMQEVFRLCLLSNVITWQADLANVEKKIPQIFHSLDQHLSLAPQFQQNFPTHEDLESDIQRLLVAIVLIPELARLDMMLKNTPAPKLNELLTSQMPRLQTLAKELQLRDIQRSMQISLLEIQARPSNAKGIGTQALVKWSDLAHQALIRQPKPPSFHQLDDAPSSFQNACSTHIEAALTECSVALIEGKKEHLLSTFQTQANIIADVASSFKIRSLEQATDTVLQALNYHPKDISLIGRLAIQHWLRYQLFGMATPESEALEKVQLSPELIELSQEPINLEKTALPSSDPVLMSLLSQVKMPDGFREYTSEDDQAIAVNQDAFGNLLQQLQLCQQEIEQLPHLPISLSQSFQDLLNTYHRLNSISMIEVLNRFQPMVKALKSQCNKDVVLKVDGGQLTIEHPKSDILYDLLAPMVSNAVIHSLETTEERQKLGKSQQGQLTIAAYTQEEDVLIELRDNGKGLNFEILREWVILHSNLAPNEGNFLSELEILDFIFRYNEDQPEISTGKGAAPDSRQGALKELNGSVEVSSIPNQGTSFRILLPKLMAEPPQLRPRATASSPYGSGEHPSRPKPDYSLDSLRLQGQIGPTVTLDTHGLFIWADATIIYFLECDRIEEYVMPQVTKADQAQQSLEWQGQTIPLFSLQDFLRADPDESPEDNNEMILVLRAEQQFLALRSPMNYLMSDSALTVNPLSHALAAPRYIYGSTQLENRTAKLVVDVAALIAQQPISSLLALPKDTPSDNPSEPVTPSQSQPKLPRIMVVDDSRTAREIVSLTLRDQGYSVIHAKDGVDALEQLRAQLAEHDRVDLVISDVAMPRMNGLEFLRQCRQDTSLQDLPIAMLSNCDSNTHSDLAKQAGANAYLTKPYENDAFLAEISKLLNTVPDLVSES